MSRPRRTLPPVFLFITLLGIPPGPPEALAAESAEAPRFDVRHMDAGVDPCDDFYRYACGNWMKSNPIPPDRGSYGRGRELQEHNLIVLRGILEKAAAPDSARSPVTQKIGDLYASCMDDKSSDARPPAPIKPELDRIAAMKSKSELGTVVGRLHSRGTFIAFSRFSGATPLFGFGSQGDFRDASRVIAGADQSGLGLPDRDYYLKDDEKSRSTRKDYQEHLTKTPCWETPRPAPRRRRST